MKRKKKKKSMKSKFNTDQKSLKKACQQNLNYAPIYSFTYPNTLKG